MESGPWGVAFLDGTGRIDYRGVQSFTLAGGEVAEARDPRKERPEFSKKGFRCGNRARGVQWLCVHVYEAGSQQRFLESFAAQVPRQQRLKSVGPTEYQADLLATDTHFFPVRSRNGMPCQRSVSIHNRAATKVSVLESSATPSTSR